MKFRVYNHPSKRFIKCYSVATKGDGTLIVWDGEAGLWLGLGEKENTIQRASGRLDKNGVEIYEGDVVKVFDNYFAVRFGVINRTVKGYDGVDRECEINGFYFTSYPLGGEPLLTISKNHLGKSDLEDTEVVGDYF